MTVNSRAAVEKAMQFMPGSKHFSASANPRITETYEEAKLFAKALRKFDKQAQHHIRSMKEFSVHTKELLNTQLPKLYKTEKTGKAVAQEGKLFGSPSDVLKVDTAGLYEQEGVRQHVQNPIYKWLADFDSLEIDMQGLDKLRLLLDSRRRSLSKVEGKLSKMRSKTEDESNPKVVDLALSQNKEQQKLQELQNEYKRKEEDTFNRIQKLIDEVDVVRAHLKMLAGKQEEVYGNLSRSVQGSGAHAETSKAVESDREQSATTPSDVATSGAEIGKASHASDTTSSKAPTESHDKHMIHVAAPASYQTA